METSNYQLCYQEALRKAHMARASNVRDAYLDLAGFYLHKIDAGLASLIAQEELNRCSAAQRLAA